MVTFCSKVSSNQYENQAYQKKVDAIAKWYRRNFERYSALMQIEANIDQKILSLLEENDEKLIDALGIRDLGYTYDAKLSYFVVSDTLIKLILSMYSYGPDDDTLNRYGVTMSASIRADSWIECSAKSVVMTELIARVLAIEKQNRPDLEWRFDLMALQVEREARNEITHRGEYARCMSAIRCYNTIRNMLIFMDSTYGELPEFEYSVQFDLNHFLATPCDFDFEHYTTVLIAESVHDVPAYQRSVVANLPWDMVIDLDGYSEQGGLLSSVSHNRIRKQVLDLSASRQAQPLLRGNTLWYRCGDYQDYSIRPGAITVNGHTSFHTGLGRPPVRKVLENLLKKMEDTDRPLNIVVLDDRQDFVQELIGLLSNFEVGSYFVTWIGLSGQNDADICRNMFYRDWDLMEIAFRCFRAPVRHFFEAFSDNRNRWTSRQPITAQFTLQGEHGPVTIDENTRINLEPYFDVLYDGCEVVPAETAEQECMNFFRGHAASWSTIASQLAVPLKSVAETKKITDHIRSVLGKTGSDPGQRFVLIKHTSGMGGTTLARQIAWELHKLKYPVLSVKSFDSVRVPTMLENLYDSILETGPFVLLVEDTMQDRDRLFEYIKRINRRCVLICACRENSGIRIPGAKEYYLKVLGDDQIAQLRNRFRSARLQQGFGPTTPEIEQYIDNALNDARMCTPFIIGLHYFENNFCIHDYVHKAIRSASPQLKDVLACMALCDKYGSKYVPSSFVRNALDVRTKGPFFHQYPAAESLICQGTENEIDVFYFKHWLLSEYFLEEYSNGAYTAMLAKTAQMLITVVESVPRINKHHINMLIYTLVQNRDYSDDFSRLMMDIGDESTQRSIMHRLADTFVEMANQAKENIEQDSTLQSIDSNSDCDLLVTRLVSHAYAHLGRMYSRHTLHNYDKAEEMFRRSLDYMVENNSRIYHMCGTGILDRLRSIWDAVIPGEKPTAELRAEFRQSIEDAADYFDCACRFGSPGYGYPSKLELYYRYLEYVYKAYEIRNDEEIRRLPPEEQLIQGEFLRTLEEAQNTAHYEDFETEARSRIEHYESRFHSSILFGHYGLAISFYENLIQKYEQQQDLDRLLLARRNLLFIRINKLRQDYGENYPYGMKTSEANKIFDDVNRILSETTGMPETYGEYRNLTAFYRYWFQFGKLTEKPVDHGLTMANRWVEIERYFSTSARNENAEPFYHLTTMLYLSILDNPLARADVSRAKELQAKLSRMDSTRRGIRYKIRDIYVNGKGMGRLRDVSRFGRQDEVLSFLQYADKELKLSRPIPVDARITDISSHAVLEIYNPNQWSSLNASMYVGKESGNSFSSNQINNRTRFLMGFGFDGIEALSATAKDLASQTFDLNEILSKAVRQRPILQRRNGYQPRIPTRIAVKPGRGAHDLIYENGKLKGLYGKLDNFTVIFTVSDIEQFGHDILAPYGSMEDIIALLQKQETVPCVPITEMQDIRQPVEVSIYRTGQSLYSLLGLSSTPVPMTQKTEPNKISDTIKDITADSVIPQKQKIKVLVTRVQEDRPAFDFSYQGNSYHGRIQGNITPKQKAMIRKACLQKQYMQIMVMDSSGKDGTFTVKIIF